MTAVLAVTTAGVVAVPVAQAVGGTITGVVRDSGGNPIAGATVLTQLQANGFNFPAFAATTDASGGYAIPGLGPATWKVTAFAPGFATRWGNASTFEAGTAVVITGDESAVFDVVLPRKNAAISGRVTDPDGNPLPGVQVNVLYKGTVLPSLVPGFEYAGYFSSAVTTDANGRYTISGLAPAKFSVSFSPLVYQPNGPPLPSAYLPEWYLDSHDPSTAAVIELSELVETGNVDAELDLGATISGQVTDPAGNPIEGISVSSPANFETGSVVTDADGRYTLIGIPPGDLGYVGAFPQDPAFLPGWYGGANFESATHLQVGLGQVITGIDIQLVAPGQVNVAVFRPDGSLAPSTFVPCIAPGMPVVVPHPAPGFGPRIVCSSGGQVNIVSNGGAFRIPVGTYNAISAEGVGAFGVTTLNPSAITTFTLTADNPIDCVFNLGGSASCISSDPATIDGDGLLPVVEDGAPNGDGNGDGVRDAEQSNVASLPAAIGGGYVTLVVAASQRITSAGVLPQSAVSQPIETGSINVGVAGVPVGGSADVTILRTSGGAATELWAFNYQTFRYAPVPADFVGSTITAHITDGGAFEGGVLPGPFAVADGLVFTNLTPVIPDHAPPTITCPSPEPVFAQFQSATITPVVTDDGSGVVIPPPTFPPLPGAPVLPPFGQYVDTSSVGSRSATFTASDKAGNTATATCFYSVVDDGDGVHPFDESGDGNGDGIADAIQSNVATVRNFSGDAPVVIASPTATQLTGLSLQPSYLYLPPSGRTLESGLVSATVTGIEPGQTIDIDLIQTAERGTTVLQFTHFGWVPLPATLTGQRATAQITDGGSGDNDGFADGSISFVGAVATGETTPPTITCYATPTFHQNQPGATVAAEVFDAGSGVASALLILPADTSILGTHSLTFVASDLAGNQSTQSCEYVVAPAIVDSTPPTVICPTPPSFIVNQPGTTLSATVSDDDSGVGSGVVTVDVATTKVGAHAVSVMASDLSGNSTTASCTYSVGVRLDRLISPDPSVVSIVHAERPVPIRWRAVDFMGAPVTDPDHFVGVNVTSTTCARGRTVHLDSERHRGLRYLGNGRWEYGWTPPQKKGCYALQLELVGTSRTARITVK